MAGTCQTLVMDEDLRLLIDLYVPPDAATAYLLLVGDRDAQPSAEVADRLAQLELIKLHPGGKVTPLPPRWAIGMLIRRRREELMKLDASLARTVAVAEDLQDLFDRVQERRGETPLVEIVHGSEAARSAVVRLLRDTRTVVKAFQPGPSSADRHQVDPIDLERLAAGVQYRCVYSTGYLSEPGAVEMAWALRDAGEIARVHNGMPGPMLIFDNHTAVLPTDRGSHPVLGCAVVRSSSVVHMCCAIFDAVWAGGTSLDGDAPDPADRIATLLLAGFHDGRIARQLDLSVRTVRRRISELMSLHGAASRSQLGAALADGRAGRPPATGS